MRNRLWLQITTAPAMIGNMSAITVKSLDEVVLRRLAEKASGAGLSMQEYVRRLLTLDAQLRSADEMVELQRARRATASTPEDLDAAVANRASKRRPDHAPR